MEAPARSSAALARALRAWIHDLRRVLRFQAPNRLHELIEVITTGGKQRTPAGTDLVDERVASHGYTAGRSHGQSSSQSIPA
jgi:hypothetical protein